MNKIFYSGMAVIAMLAAPAVRAQQDKFYAGIAVAGSGNVSIFDAAGRTENTNKPLALDLYGGYDITQNFAVEAGYASQRKFEFGSRGTLGLHAVHVAAKASMALGESFSLYGKLGLARHSDELSVAGEGSDSITRTRPLIGIGAEYRLPANFALTLGLTDYGTVKSGASRLTMRKLEAGLNYHF